MRTSHHAVGSSVIIMCPALLLANALPGWLAGWLAKFDSLAALAITVAAVVTTTTGN